MSIPNLTERAKDMRDLMILHLWDNEQWSAGEIASVLNIGRGAVLGMVRRVWEVEPECVRRSPGHARSL